MDKKRSFRDYSDCKAAVRECYRKQRAYQTRAFATRLRDKYCAFEHKASFWDLFDSLSHFVDLSDPDINLPNAHHLFQTAEAIRKAGHPKWFQVVGLIHDLGKIMYRFGCDADGTSLTEQWSIVGDTFVTGCAIPETAVYPEFNALNPDHREHVRNGGSPTDCGSYGPDAKGKGLESVVCSFGHDEYLYWMLRRNGAKLPEQAFYMIRYHSLYLWHKHDEYAQFENKKDRLMKPWVKAFNAFDLYTKTDEPDPNWDAMRRYYASIVPEFLPDVIHY